jgi:hypothetical protein
MVLYFIFIVVGIVLFGAGIQIWVASGDAGLWSSVVTVLGFSFLVIGADEVMHARRRRLRERAGAARVAH